MIDISIIFKGTDVLKRIAEYLNMLDSVSSRISRLEKCTKIPQENLLKTHPEPTIINYKGITLSEL